MKITRIIPSLRALLHQIPGVRLPLVSQVEEGNGGVRDNSVTLTGHLSWDCGDKAQHAQWLYPNFTISLCYVITAKVHVPLSFTSVLNPCFLG